MGPRPGGLLGGWYTAVQAAGTPPLYKRTVAPVFLFGSALDLGVAEPASYRTAARLSASPPHQPRHAFWPTRRGSHGLGQHGPGPRPTDGVSRQPRLTNVHADHPRRRRPQPGRHHDPDPGQRRDRHGIEFRFRQFGIERQRRHSDVVRANGSAASRASGSGVLVAQGGISLPGGLSSGSGSGGGPAAGGSSPSDPASASSSSGGGNTISLNSSGTGGVAADLGGSGDDGGGGGRSAQGSHLTNDQVAGLIGMGYSDEQIMAADQLCLQGATDEEIWTVLGAPPPPEPVKREPLLVLKQRTPDQVMMDLADKAEPILRPVIVYGGAAVGLAGNVGGAVAGYALLVDPDPTASKVVGTYMVVVNVDGIQANVRTLVKGDPVPTVLNQTVKAGLIKLGRTESQADQRRRRAILKHPPGV